MIIEEDKNGKNLDVDIIRKKLVRGSSIRRQFEIPIFIKTNR